MFHDPVLLAQVLWIQSTLCPPSPPKFPLKQKIPSEVQADATIACTRTRTLELPSIAVEEEKNRSPVNFASRFHKCEHKCKVRPAMGLRRFKDLDVEIKLHRFHGP